MRTSMRMHQAYQLFIKHSMFFLNTCKGYEKSFAIVNLIKHNL